MSQEQRFFERYDVDFQVHFWEGHNGNKNKLASTGTCRNCSLGGIYFTTDTLLQINKLITIQFDISIDEETIETIQVQSIIAWVKDWTEPRGIGLKFINFTGSQKEKYDKWINTLKTERTDIEER